MDRDALRAWVAARGAAESRELAELTRQAPTPGDAIASMLAVLALTGRLVGWPLPEEGVTGKESEQARRNWVALRARWLG